MAKKGMTPSAIGVLLRDQHGIPQVTTVTGSKILRILKGSGLAPDIPEDLYFLIKKAVSMRKHLERNRKDKDGKFRLILIESRIHRLARYYKVQTAGAAVTAVTLSVVRAACHGAARRQQQCCSCCGCRRASMLFDDASGFNPGVCRWSALVAAAGHYQHPGFDAAQASGWLALLLLLTRAGSDALFLPRERARQTATETHNACLRERAREWMIWAQARNKEEGGV